MDQAIRATRELIGNRDVPAIFEGTFEHNGVLVRVDVLYRRKDERWRLIEVKSTTDVKDHHLEDVAIQHRVVTRSGVDLAASCLAHVSRDYVYEGGTIDASRFFQDSEPDPDIDAYPQVDHGQTLSQKMRSQQLPAKEILSLGVQVAGALEEAHEQGVVHRDLKPSNIMVTPKGHAKVLDFGLAKLLEPVGTPEVTLSLADTHGPVGTALYMSPEQAEGKLVDSRTDLWSFGVVLYEALAGKPPFQGANALAILRAVSTEDPKSVRDIRPETPEGADQIVSHALEKDLSQRYQSASEISRDLSDVLLQLSAPSLPAADRASRFSPRILLTAIVLLLLLAGSVMWLYQRSERRHWAREEAIPAIAKLKSEDKSLAAFLLLKKAEQYLPDDPQLARLAEQNTTQSHPRLQARRLRSRIIYLRMAPGIAWAQRHSPAFRFQPATSAGKSRKRVLANLLLLQRPRRICSSLWTPQWRLRKECLGSVEARGQI